MGGGRLGPPGHRPDLLRRGRACYGDNEAMQAIILHGGSVLACDGAGTRASALAIRDGRVIAIGELDDVRVVAGVDARRLDLGGATVLSGAVGTHPHMMHFGVLTEPLVDLSDAVDNSDIVERIAAKAE